MKNYSIPGLLATGLTTLFISFSLGATDVFAATINVNNISDTPIANKCSLREAITAHNIQNIVGGCVAGTNNDLVKLTIPGSYAIKSNLPPIFGNIAIVGQGASLTNIDGANKYQILQVNQGASLKLLALTIQHGFDSAILNWGNLVILNTTFDKNSTTNFPTGGAINNMGTLSVFNSTFSGNSAIGNGAVGGAIYNYNQPLTISNSLFFDNSSSVLGGAILSTAPLSINNSTFSDNSITENLYGISGGAIYIQYQGVVSKITNSTFSGNSGLNGGAIGNQGPLLIANSTFFKNYADYNGSAIYNSGPSANGNSGGDLTIINSTFSDNSTGINGLGQIYRDLGSVIIKNTIVNSTLGFGQNCAGSIIDGGNNLEYLDIGPLTCNFVINAVNNQNPLLQGLANYGGVTQTMAIDAGSPAAAVADAVVCAQLPVNGLDQRGFHRSIKTCDIGAYDLGY